jgi:hypothetical protein
MLSTMPAEFWSTSAQVLPALLIVIAIERVVGTEDLNFDAVVNFFIRIIAIALIIVAEFFAIVGMDRPSPWAARVVVWGIGAGLALVVPLAMPKDTSSLSNRSSTIITNVSVQLAFVVLLAAIGISFTPLVSV